MGKGSLSKDAFEGLDTKFAHTHSGGGGCARVPTTPLERFQRKDSLRVAFTWPEN